MCLFTSFFKVSFPLFSRVLQGITEANNIFEHEVVNIKPKLSNKKRNWTEKGFPLKTLGFHEHINH